MTAATLLPTLPAELLQAGLPCVGLPIDQLHPHAGEHRIVAAQRLADTARDHCGTCPVRQVCRQWGITNSQWGVWGGALLTEDATLASGRAVTDLLAPIVWEPPANSDTRPKPVMITAGEVRDHLARLFAAGETVASISRASGVADSTVRRLSVSQTRVSSYVAGRLLAVEVPGV